VTHQAQELWLKLISQEAVEVVAEMDGDLLWPATGRLERMLRTMRCLVAEMGILETMTPDTYQIIRRSLGNGSGQESPGYNAMRLSADAMESALERCLMRRNLRLLDVYKVGSVGAEDLKRICEQFVDLDEGFQNWLYTHYQMVRRIIGVDRSIKALDGLPTQVLAGRMTLPLFRKLWEVRVEMTNAWRRDGGYAPGVHRAAGTQAEAPPPPGAPPQASGLIAEAVSAHASSAHAPMPEVVEFTPAEPSPLEASAQALAAAAASVDPVVTASAPPVRSAPSAAAAPADDDPWSRPEPPRRGQSTGIPLPPPAPPEEDPNDPWSRPEPPTSRFAAQLQEEAKSGVTSKEPGPNRWARPTPKDQEQH
jgi:tryptophan 2,3-dioxygenase